MSHDGGGRENRPAASRELLGWAEDGPTLDLDHREFSYAGKFVLSMSGKAVTRDDGGIVAAIAFGPDRTDPDRLWLRYVTVRRDRRGEGIGPDLVRFVVDRATDRGYDRVRIAVNNPYAFEALYRAGFGFTGETTGIAELILDRPRPGPEPDRYRAGFAAFVDRDLSDGERSFVARRRDGTPPTVE